jgi:hypothetical protein
MNGDETETPILAEAAEPQPPKVGESRGAVLLLLFVALGPLALGVLWRSSRFSTPWKVVLTVLTLGQFVLVVWLLWFTVRWMLEGMEPFL